VSEVGCCKVAVCCGESAIDADKLEADALHSISITDRTPSRFCSRQSREPARTARRGVQIDHDAGAFPRSIEERVRRQ
jgi:hypothetical protein